MNAPASRCSQEAITMDRSGQTLEVIDGGREALERAYMWAILFDRPDKQALARRLEPSANDVLCAVAPDEDGTRVPRRSGARPAGHRCGQGRE
jgi:hypothetical protein